MLHKKKGGSYKVMPYEDFMKGYADQDYEYKYMLKGKMSFGNKKLPKDTAIFNMGSGIDCPSKKLGLCKVINAGVNCYAISAERMYPSVLPYRRRQEVYWKSVTAEQFVEDFMTRIARKRTQIKRLRVNESGDLWDQESYNKIVKIANILWEKHHIRTYMYTAREDLNLKNHGALNVQGSGFKVVNNYKAIADIPFPLRADERECKCDCKVCNLCVVAKDKTIYVPFH